MAWPTATDYNRAIQSPPHCFSDPELKQGQAAGMMGLPRPWSGNFADVYQVNCPNGASWAVKCFTREVEGLRDRYRAISDHLDLQRRRFTVEFQYLPEGIRVRDEWFPVVKMRWVEGLTLNEFVRDHLDNRPLLERLAGLWERLAGEMNDAWLAHGDLQHGNVLLVPKEEGSLVLRLIDYDGMWVPTLADVPPGEVGHADYQHPERLAKGGYFAEVDAFALLVIYTALRALILEGPALWERHNNDDNLLFRRTDFSRPGKSKLFTELLYHRDPGLRALAGHLLLASQGPLERVPFLPDLLARGLALSDVDLDRSRALVPPCQRGGGEVPVVKPVPLAPIPAWLCGAAVASAPAPVRTGTAAPGSPLPRPRQAPAADTGRMPISSASTVVAPPVQPGVAPPAPHPEAIPLAPRKPETNKAAPAALLVLPPGRAQPLARGLAPGPLPAVVGASLEEGRKGAPNPARPLVGKTAIKSAFVAPAPVVEKGPQGAAPSHPPPEAPRGVGPRAHKRRLFLGLGALLLALPLLGLLTWALWPGHRANPLPPPRPTVAPLLPLTLRGGQRVPLEVVVERDGLNEPLQVSLGPLPEGLMAAPQPLPEGTSRATLELEAKLEVKGGKHQVPLSVWSKKRKVAEAVLALTVEELKFPRMAKEIGEVTLAPGKQRLIEIEIDRQGNDDSLTVRVEGLPPGVEQHAAPARPPGRVIVLQLKATADAGEKSEFVVVALMAGRHEVARQTIKVTVRRPALKEDVSIGIAVAAVAMKAGETKDVPLTLERNGYTGAVELELRGLPRGVRRPPGDAPKLSAADDTEVGKSSVKVVALVEGRKAGEQAFDLTIEKAPAVAPAVKAVPEPKQVTFVSADEAILKGTYYPNPEGKKGGCVLMVPEPGLTREEPGWAALAKALQKQGCAVLTFDWRGHGDSTGVNPGFWDWKVNKALVGKGARPAFAPKFLPASYRPWLVQDLAAARHFLDLRHDEGELNSRNLIVIGAGEGSTLGLLWLATEQHRFQSTTPLVPTLRAQPEARDVAGAIWLSQPPFRGSSVALEQTVANFLAESGRQRQQAMTFLHGQNDRLSALRAQQFLIRSPAAVKAGNFTRKAVPGTAQIGQGLLQPGLDTEKMVVAEVAAILTRHGGRPWEERNVAAAPYFYKVGGLTMAVRRTGLRGPLVALEQFKVHVPTR